MMTKDSFDEELVHVYFRFTKYLRNILLGDFSKNLGREDVFKLIDGNESLYETSNDNEVTVLTVIT